MKNFIKTKYQAIILWAVAIITIQYFQLGDFNFVPFVLALAICAVMELVKDKLVKKYMKNKDSVGA